MFFYINHWEDINLPNVLIIVYISSSHFDYDYGELVTLCDELLVFFFLNKISI